MDIVTREIAIAAQPADVWRVITGFADYGEWNPLITRIEGRAALGEGVTVHLALPGGLSLPIAAEIVACRKNEALAWRSHLLTEGLFDREHMIAIVANATGCIVAQSQSFGGAAGSVARGLTGRAVEHGFERMNAALKRRVEGAG